MPARTREYLINAGLVKRLLAFAIDLLVLDFIVLEPFRGFLSGILPQGSVSSLYSFIISNDYAFNMLYTSSLFMGFIILLYFVIMEWKIGQTVGKMLFGIYVVSLDDLNHKKVASSPAIRKPARLMQMKFWQAIAENMLFIPIFPFFLLIFVDPIYLFFNRGNQRLSEQIGKVIVVEKYYG